MELPVPAWVRLGALLLRSGLITPAQLETALAEQVRDGLRLGEILRSRGWISSRDLAEALAEQFGLEFVDLATEKLDAHAVSLLPEGLARRFGAVPIRFTPDGSLLVALADPSDTAAVQALRADFEHDIELAVADEDELSHVLELAHAPV